MFKREYIDKPKKDSFIIHVDNVCASTKLLQSTTTESIVNPLSPLLITMNFNAVR